MIIIVDNFYPNPDEVRKKALKQFFFPGNKGKKNLFPGKRTQGTNIQNWLYLKNKYEDILIIVILRLHLDLKKLI